MGSFFGTLFMGKTAEEKEQEAEQKEEEKKEQIKATAPMINNEILCNGCGQAIEGNPRYFNMNGRKMYFHKNCFKKLKNGNVNF